MKVAVETKVSSCCLFYPCVPDNWWSARESVVKANMHVDW